MFLFCMEKPPVLFYLMYQLTSPSLLIVKQESCEYQFLSILVWLDDGIEPSVYRLHLYNL